MQKSKVYVFIFDGYSDWEPPYAMAELNKSDRYQLLTVAVDKKPVKSVGGLTIIPDLSWNELEWSRDDHCARGTCMGEKETQRDYS
jgi:hypothetical protein